MEGVLVFVLVLGFVFGGLTLALLLGYLSSEEARAVKTGQRPARVAHVDAIPSFFAKADAALPAEMREFDEALLVRIEKHIREEQALVGEFVEYPSVHSLYRRAPQELRAH
jgi:hypothetical protein